MKRFLRLVAVAIAPALLIGCESMGPVFNPAPLPTLGAPVCRDDNPVYIPLSVKDYGKVFETIWQIVGDYGFEIAESNRFDGRLETRPRIAPGLALLAKPGSPELYQRLLSTTQTYRHRVTVLVQPADHGGFHGGYFVEFIARKELEDLPRPIRSTVGGAVLRSENTIERQSDVIDATFFEPNWIFKGRDAALEQELIRRFNRALGSKTQ